MEGSRQQLKEGWFASKEVLTHLVDGPQEPGSSPLVLPSRSCQRTMSQSRVHGSIGFRAGLGRHSAHPALSLSLSRAWGTVNSGKWLHLHPAHLACRRASSSFQFAGAVGKPHPPVRRKPSFANGTGQLANFCIYDTRRTETRTPVMFPRSVCFGSAGHGLRVWIFLPNSRQGASASCRAPPPADAWTPAQRLAR